MKSTAEESSAQIGAPQVRKEDSQREVEGRTQTWEPRRTGRGGAQRHLRSLRAAGAAQRTQRTWTNKPLCESASGSGQPCGPHLRSRPAQRWPRPGVARCTGSILSPAPLSWGPQCVFTLATTKRASCRQPSWCRPATCPPGYWVHRKPRPRRKRFWILLVLLVPQVRHFPCQLLTAPCPLPNPKPTTTKASLLSPSPRRQVLPVTEKHSIDLGEPLATSSPLLTVSFLPGLLWS